MELLTILLVLFMAMGTRGHDVMDFGAAGDGETDDSRAFLNAWKAVCEDDSDFTLKIPGGRKFLLKPVEFLGPCKSSKINVQVSGDLVAPTMSHFGDNVDRWITFRSVDGLSVTGEGQIDGKGQEWWEAFESGKLEKRPTVMAFYGCDNLVLEGLSFLNSQKNHISVSGSNGATISNLRITAPDESPNTDGINISGSTNVHVKNCFIGTGDDCIAIGDHNSQIFISQVSCGPGHGISIGSLGKDGDDAAVEDIHVTNCTFKGTQNGARIKTWQGGSGYARKISFETIRVDKSHNPILIDQYYCPHSTCDISDSAVKISDITFKEFRGTSSSEEAINLSCSESVKCTNIRLDNVQLKPASSDSKAHAKCINAEGSATITDPVVSCLE